MLERVRGVFVAMAMGLVVAGAGAQVPAGLDADTKELATYRLSMETLRKVQVATRVMVAEMKNDPKVLARLKLDAEIEALEKKSAPTEAESVRLTTLQQQRDAQGAAEPTDLDDANTLSEMAARMRAFRPMATGLDKAGLSPREYAKFMLSMVQAAAVANLRKAGVSTKLPSGVSDENVQFVEAHEAELKAMQEEFERLGQALDRQG